MKLAVAGDSAGEGLATVLAEHLKGKHEVSEVSRTDAGPEPFYADLSDRVANGVLSGKYDRAILVCGTGIGVCIWPSRSPTPSLPRRSIQTAARPATWPPSMRLTPNTTFRPANISACQRTKVIAVWATTGSHFTSPIFARRETIKLSGRFRNEGD
jgi:hypothetical protein